MEERKAWVTEINNTGSIQQAVDSIATSSEANAYQAEELDILADTTADNTFADDITTEDTDSIKTNDEGERLYYWVPSSELGDVSRTSTEAELYKDKGGYYTEEEIRAAWDSEQGMGYLKEKTDWNNYWGYLTERQDLIDQGVLSDGAAVTQAGRDARQELIDAAGGLRAAGGAKAVSQGTRKINAEAQMAAFEAMVNDPVQVELMEKHGIPMAFQNDDGDVFQWNGSSFTKTIKTPGTDWGALVMGTMLALTVGPAAGKAIAGGLGVSGGVATGAISGAVGSALSQGVVTGSIDPKQLLVAGSIGAITGLATEMANAQSAANAKAALAADNFADSFSMLSASEAAAFADTVAKHGHLIDVYGVTASTIDSGFVMGAAGAGGLGSAIQTNVSNLANTLGISYEATLNTVEGVATGAVAGKDVESIVINALGNVGEAHIMQGLENTFGDSIDVKNLFKDGYTDIPVDALQPIVSGGIEAAIDGGMSVKDALTTAANYFGEGGNLDFLLPPGAEFSLVFPNLCPEGSTNPLCNLKIPEGGNFDIDCPSLLKNSEGECLDPDIGFNPTCPEGFEDVDGTCLPTSFNFELCTEEELNLGGYTNRTGSPDSWYCYVPNIDIKVCSDEEKASGGIEIKVGNPDSWYCKMPDVLPEIELCTEEELNQGGYTDRTGSPDSWYCYVPNIDIKVCSDEEKASGGIEIKVGNPDSWYCKMPDIDIQVCSEEQLSQGGIEIKAGNPDSWYCKMPEIPDVGCEDKQVANGVQKYKKNSLGECVPDVIECVEGFDLKGQTCVEIDITTPCLGGKVRNETTGECECPPGKRENSLGICVDPIDNCPSGQQRNAEGVCEDIEKSETPDVDTPDIGLPSFEMPDINIPQFQPTQFQQPTQVTASPQLLTRTEFPITDYLSQAIQGGGMLTGNGNKIV